MLKKALFLLAFLTFSSSSFAISLDEINEKLPFTIHGRVYTDQYFYVNPSEQFESGSLEQSSFSAWFELDYHKSDFGAHVVEQLDLFARSIEDKGTVTLHSNLREAYASYSTPGHEIKMGQQIIPWGKSDGVNPTDYFTAKNAILMNPDEEVKRLGAPAVHYSFTPEQGNSPINFEFVFQAYYPQMKLLIPNEILPAGLSFQKYPDNPSVFEANSMEYGVKLSYLKSNYDFSISAFRGSSQYPEYILDPRRLLVYPINPRETAFGGDASFTWGSYVVRLESAIHLPDNGSSDDPLYGFVEPYHWDTVVGAERPFFTDFRVQVQLLLRYHLNYQAPPTNAYANPQLNFVQQGVGKANALILNYQHQVNPGSTIRISYSNDSSKWSADVFLLGYFAGGQDYLIRPQVGYTPITNLKLQAGLDYYGGNPNLTLGALNDQSDAFFEAKYVF